MAPSGLSPKPFSAPANRTPALPRLPVPNLHQTLSKYLQSLVPLLQEDEARGGALWQPALQERRRWADEFERGLSLDKSSPRNWLDDNIWLKKAYHEWRLPLLIHSNWWLAFFNDDCIPEHVLREPASSKLVQLTFRHLEFKDSLASKQEINPNITRTGLWFQETVAKIFNTFPQPLPDVSNARKILVMVNDWTYAVEQRLRCVVQDVTRRIQAGEEAVPIGMLSADHRDHWTENLRYLLSLSTTNQQNLEAIQQSILAVSLDSHTLGLHLHNYAYTPHTPPAINSAAEIDYHLNSIRSSINARSRWFDKGYTIIGEHSPCDGLAPSIVADYALAQSIVSEIFLLPEPPSLFSGRDLDIAGWERLDWVTDTRIKAECITAESRVEGLIDDSDNSALWFFDYGADWIKSVAGLSPDAYVQMAIQLAWYKTRGSFTAMYETALTCAFDKARTETIRTLSEDSRAWVLSMADEAATTSTRFVLLRRAIQTHTSLTREAATGRGIDRHLLGLRLMLRASRVCLMTHYSRGAKNLCGPDLIKFSIESKFSCAETSTTTSQSTIANALGG
ncbi:acyltransferase ChoActase/COT/CPT [Russula compacta]|nr:acyltransferase ChoActase/COT/CPT [Russula compacta]